MRFFLIILILLSVAVNPVHAKYAKPWVTAPEGADMREGRCSKGFHWRWWPQAGCWFRIY